MARRKKNEDEPQENQDKINNESDETFGLPEVEYEPLKRDEPVSEPETPPAPAPEPVAEPVYERPVEEVAETREEITNDTYQHEEQHPNPPREEVSHEYVSSYHYEPEKSPMWPKILGILLVLLLVGGAVYYFAVFQPAQKEAARQRELNERNAELEAKSKREQAERDRIAKEREQKRLDSLANIPKTGTIEMLSSRTGQYYVVAASDIDDDLLMDYANKLIKTGKNVKIIPPFGKKGRYFRLAIESKDNYADAQASADGMKGGEFGDQLWVVRY